MVLADPKDPCVHTGGNFSRAQGGDGVQCNPPPLQDQSAIAFTCVPQLFPGVGEWRFPFTESSARMMKSQEISGIKDKHNENVQKS